MKGSGSISWKQSLEIATDKLEKFIQNQEKLSDNDSSFEAECKLTKLHQITSVLDYQIEFELLSRRATKMSELILVSLFISGLKPKIRRELHLNRPTSLKEAFTSAMFHGSRLEGLKLVVTNVDDELTNSELDTKDVIDVEFAGCIVEAKNTDVLIDSNVATEIVETPVLKVETKINVPKINSVLQDEVVDEEKLTSSTLKVVVHTPLLIHQLRDITPTIHLVRPVVSELNDFPQEFLLINGDRVRLIMHRRRVVFKFYMLEEVYQKSLSLHLEDKVILKDGRVDTIQIFSISYFNY